MLENNFNHYIIELDYHTEYSCEDSGCYEDICRCGRINDIRIISIDFNKLVDMIYDSLTDYNSKAGKRQQRISQLLYGGEVVDKYCINRIITKYKLYKTCNWTIQVDGGYYGDEIGNITINQVIFDLVKSECQKLMELETISEKIKLVLSLEYGYLLPDLGNKDFEIIRISKSDIDFKSLNQNHIKLVNEEKSVNGLNHYNSFFYHLPRGVVRKIGNQFKIVDGFHRIMEIDSTGEFEVFCVND